MDEEIKKVEEGQESVAPETTTDGAGAEEEKTA